MAALDWKKSADELKSRIQANEAALQARVKSSMSGGTIGTPSSLSTSAPNYASGAPNYSMPASSYSGPASVIGNVSGSQDIGKSYQDIFNSTRNESNMYKQLNTWGDNKGNVYDTTQMTPQQIFALSLSKNNNTNASAVLKGMGLDMNGNPTSPITYTPNSTSATNTPYTKNPTVDAMPIDQQLAYYAKNPQEAQQEIARAQGVGGTAAMNWASQLQGVIPQSQGSSQLTGGASVGQGTPMGQPMGGQPGGQAGGQMGGQPRDNSWISQSVMDELAKQKQAIDQQLAQLQQSSQLNVNQNNQFLADQTKKLQEQKAVTDQQIQNFQNRRGGFYSGGVDFQMGNNTRSTNEAVGSVTKDVQARNNDIWGRNSLLAQQAAEKISLLTQQAPDKIRELVQQQMEKDQAQANIDRTFNYNAGQDQINNDRNAQKDALALRNQHLAEAADLSARYGITVEPKEDYSLMLDQIRGLPTVEQRTAAAQQKAAQEKSAWQKVETFGYVTPDVADILGIPAGTQTQQAKQAAAANAIASRNASTAEKNAATSAANAANKPTPSSGGFNLDDYKSYIGQNLIKEVANDPSKPWVTSKQLDVPAAEKYILGLNIPNEQKAQLYQLYNIPMK